MNILDTIKNKVFYRNKYKTHSEAVIIACYYNPQNSPYRKQAFQYWYNSIKHLNHQIIECVIGDSKPELPENSNIRRIYTKNLLWHKEALLNKIIKRLPDNYKYVFWLDTDVIFTNLNWLIESVEELQIYNLIQPFEYCVHLEKDQLQPDFNYIIEKLPTHQQAIASKNGEGRHPMMWKSFGANCADKHYNDYHNNLNYDVHGHVGFAWGAKREILDAVPLYDKALIGGADHIIAHAAMGQIPHNCIDKSFQDKEALDDIYQWSEKFYKVVKGKVGYTPGDLFHIWHGDLENREYFKRVQEFTPKTKAITEKDDNGLYVTDDEDTQNYMNKYFKKRESSHRSSQTDDADVVAGLINPLNPLSPLWNVIDNTPTDQRNQNIELGKGESGGGGAGGSWYYPVLPPNNISVDQTYLASTPSGNFS